MLDRPALLNALNAIADQLFLDDGPAYDLAQKTWAQICADPTFIYRVKEIDAPWPVPTWEGKLDKTIPVSPAPDSYKLLSIDGSQIYPDRHQGVSCFLINVGGVLLQYGQASPVAFFSQPYLFTEAEDELQVSTEYINCKRQELELRDGVTRAQKDQLLLFDGSLIFWHLEAKDPRLKETFLSKYLACLFELHQKQILCASYISAPKSRELINLLRLQLCSFDLNKPELYKPIERLKDSSICSFYLPIGHRSIVFKNHATISKQYPDAVQPYFFYINVGHEIGRVELPAWIAHDEQKTNIIASLVLDQSEKGRGYPVALSEAHEQAVVKGPDREFFYHLLTKMGMERQHRSVHSQKVMRKRGMGI